MLEGAAACIIVLGDEDKTDVWVEDCSNVILTMHYMAASLGLGSCWIQVRDRQWADGTPAEDVVRDILQLPAHLRVLSIVALGQKGMERKPFNEDRLLWDKVTEWK